jgi:hypothetical protein
MVTAMVQGRRRGRLRFSIAIALLTISCSNPFGSPWEEVVGTVSEYQIASGEVLGIPTDVVAGAAVMIRVTTGGSGSCTRIGRTKVEWEDERSLTITPYDESKLGSGEVCSYNFVPLSHSVTVRFPLPGSYTVRVRAHFRDGESPSVVAERAINVH